MPSHESNISDNRFTPITFYKFYNEQGSIIYLCFEHPTSYFFKLNFHFSMLSGRIPSYKDESGAVSSCEIIRIFFSSQKSRSVTKTLHRLRF